MKSDLDLKIRFLQKLKTGCREIEKKQKDQITVQIPATMHSFLKRCLDILVSFMALVFLAPGFSVDRTGHTY